MHRAQDVLCEHIGKKQVIDLIKHVDGINTLHGGSGITRSLSHASASGVFVARQIAGCAE